MKAPLACNDASIPEPTTKYNPQNPDKIHAKPVSLAQTIEFLGAIRLWATHSYGFYYNAKDRGNPSLIPEEA